MKRSLLVLKDINYGASIDSATVNTALTPDLLADGALGIYAINPATNKHVLITDAASGTGLLAAATTVHEFVMFVGTSVAGKPIKTGAVKVSDLTVRSSHYVAPVKQVYSVGYNTSTTSGSLNLPATIARGDEALIKIIDKAQVDDVLRTGDTYSGYASVASDTDYNIIADLVVSVDNDEDAKVVADIVGNGTSAAVTASDAGGATVVHVVTGTPTVTGSVANGSNTLTLALSASTFEATQTIAVGDYVRIAGGLYVIAAQDFTTDDDFYVITLDRPYKGTTLAAAAAANFHFYSVEPTEFGLTFTDSEFDAAINIVTLGILSSATSAVVTDAVRGNGTAAHLIVKEKQTWDRVDRIDRRYDLPVSQVASGGTYDQYNMAVANSYRDKAGSGSTKSSQSEIIVATPTGIADTAGKNQSNFEDILTALGVTFTSII